MMSEGKFHMQMSKEHEEYMQALTKQEIHKKELEATAKHLETFQKEIEPLKIQSERIKELYDKLDRMLGEKIVLLCLKLDK